MLPQKIESTTVVIRAATSDLLKAKRGGKDLSSNEVPLSSAVARGPSVAGGRTDENANVVGSANSVAALLGEVTLPFLSDNDSPPQHKIDETGAGLDDDEGFVALSEAPVACAFREHPAMATFDLVSGDKDFIVPTVPPKPSPPSAMRSTPKSVRMSPPSTRATPPPQHLASGELPSGRKSSPSSTRASLLSSSRSIMGSDETTTYISQQSDAFSSLSVEHHFISRSPGTTSLSVGTEQKRKSSLPKGPDDVPQTSKLQVPVAKRKATPAPSVNNSCLVGNVGDFIAVMPRRSASSSRSVKFYDESVDNE